MSSVKTVTAETVDHAFREHFNDAAQMMGDKPGKIYVIIGVGMGCSFYLKRDDVGKPIYGFFMHSDDWGQYGPETDRRPDLSSFTDGYTDLASLTSSTGGTP